MKKLLKHWAATRGIGSFNRSGRLAALFAALLIGVSPAARAVSYTFTGITPTSWGWFDWADASNWSPSGGPPAGGTPNDLTFPTFGSFTFIISHTVGVNVNDITFNNANDYRLDVSNCSTWQVTGSLIQNGTGSSLIDAPYSNLKLANPILNGTSGSGLMTLNGLDEVTGNITVNGGNHEWLIQSVNYCIGGGSGGPPVLTPTTLTANGGSLRILSDANMPFTGPVNINAGGSVCLKAFSTSVNFSAPSWTIASGGTLKVGAGATLTGTSTGTILSGTAASGCSVATGTIVGGLACTSTAVLEYELATPGVIGGGVNDLFNITGNLTLDGTLVVLPQASFGVGTYRLFNYTGTLTDNGLSISTLPSGLSGSISTATSGQVNLIVQSAGTNCCDGCTAPYSASQSVTVPPGYSYLANPFCRASNDFSLSQILPNVPDGSIVLKFDSTTQTYEDAYTFDTGVWYDSNFNVSLGSIAPGEGFAFFNPTASPLSITFTGCEPQCPLPCSPLTNKFTLVGRFGGGTATWDDLFSCPPECGARIQTWNGSGFNTFDFINGAWTPSVPVLAAGTSAFATYIPTNCPTPCPQVLSYTVRTGIDAGGALLPTGATELLWTNIHAPGGSTPMVVITPGAVPPWVAPSTNSQWVGPSTSGIGNAGPYTNVWTFNADCTNVCLTGRFTTDNAGYLYVNGTLVAGPASFSAWTPVNVCNGFVAGVNTIQLVVNNTEGPTGYRTELEVFTQCCTTNTNNCVIVCPADITVTNAPSACATVVNYPAPTLSGDCDTNAIIVCTPPSGSLFGIGTNTVTCVASNSSGAFSECNFQIVVRDLQNPTIVACASNRTIRSCYAVLAPDLRGEIQFTDCQQLGVTITQTPAPGTPLAPGVNNFAFSIQDPSGNGVGCLAQVTVVAASNLHALGLFNTGVDNAGGQIAIGATDPHYIAVSAPVGLSLIGPTAVNSVFGWGLSTSHSSLSHWINIGYTAYGSSGTYVYRLTLDLSSVPVAERACLVLKGRWAADNKADLFINGALKASVPITSAYNSWTPLVVSGLPNTSIVQLEFHVFNGGGPTGLRVEWNEANCDGCNGWVGPFINANASSATFHPATNAVLNLSFTNVVSGTGPLNYQWYQNGVPISNGSNVTGATTPTLNISTNNPAWRLMKDEYYCVVENAVGVVCSTPVEVSNFQIANVTASAGQMQFTFPSRTNGTNVIEFSTSLGGTNWQPMQTNLGTGGPITVTLPTDGAQGFWRVRIWEWDED